MLLHSCPQMERFFILFILLHLLSFFVVSSSHIEVTNSLFFSQPLCHEDERSALLQFKQSFSVEKFASDDPSAYPKTKSWKIEGENSTNCCSWDGVECDEESGHVIGLVLSSSFLYGSIHSSSSLFRLVHLQKLDLAYNHFNYSQIPVEIGQLSSLTSLNLSGSFFFGQIPSEISKLSKLASLDLCCNVNPPPYSKNLLKLEKPNLRDLAQNLTSLEELSLSNVNISSEVPYFLTNFSSLRGLALENSGLYGEFPTGIFLLPKLQYLILHFNKILTGYLPEFHQISSPLLYLGLAGTSFSGKLPDSIGNLSSLKWLHLADCNFSGSLPDSIGNLNQLVFFNLSYNDFSGHIPPSFRNLTQISFIDLDHNQLVGGIPSWLLNLTHLTVFVVGNNKLHGQIPSSLFELNNLKFLILGFNNLNGTVKLDTILKLKNLVRLSLASNDLSIIHTNVNTSNTTLPKFEVLNLSSCNLGEFPNFLLWQDELVLLILNDNNIHGQVPKWVWNTSINTLEYLGLANNFLTGFEQHPVVLPQIGLHVIDLSNNMLVGSLPIPPVFGQLQQFSVSNNMLTGNVPEEICHASSLYELDLSGNNLGGIIPQCLGNFSNSLLVLNLRGNNFSGTLPVTFMNGNKLKLIDLSQNQLLGQIPRSLAYCTELEFLDLGYNQIHDIFPLWLGAFPVLQVLILRSNKLYGTIATSHTNYAFPQLRIIDLSHNGLTGHLPSQYFQNWNAMKNVNEGLSNSMETDVIFPLLNGSEPYPYRYSMTLTNKGTLMMFFKILRIFTAIDMSSNEFTGEIPESLGNLRGLRSINLSNNDFTGCIPSTLENLAKLESLDLSYNILTGEIPQQLSLLTFLAIFDVSHNHLTGPIPQGKQFATFSNNSYKENLGLCGLPVSKRCVNSEPSASLRLPTSEHGEDLWFSSGLHWMIILMGCASGLVVGLVIGNMLTTRYHEWFVETFGRKKQKP